MAWSDIVAVETYFGHTTGRLDVVSEGDFMNDSLVPGMRNGASSGAIHRELWRLQVEKLQCLREEIQSSDLGVLRYLLDNQVVRVCSWINETGVRRRGLGWS